MFRVIGPVATTNDVTYVTPSYVVDHSPSVGQARHFRSWPRGWIRSWPRGLINGIGPVAIFNVSGPSYEIVYMPELGHLLCVCRDAGQRIGTMQYPLAIIDQNDVKKMSAADYSHHRPMQDIHHADIGPPIDSVIEFGSFVTRTDINTTSS